MTLFIYTEFSINLFTTDQIVLLACHMYASIHTQIIAFYEHLWFSSTMSSKVKKNNLTVNFTKLCFSHNLEI